MNETKQWMRWFDGETYLGERSARTAPDMRTRQPCDCAQCTTPVEKPAQPLDLGVKRALVEPFRKRTCGDIGASYVKAYGEFAMAICSACSWRGPQRVFGGLETIRGMMGMAETDRAQHAGGAA